jgi:hypothetical protein
MLELTGRNGSVGNDRTGSPGINRIGSLGWTRVMNDIPPRIDTIALRSSSLLSGKSRISIVDMSDSKADAALTTAA